MTSAPVEDLADTFVELADSLVDEFDLVDFLDLLADRCTLLLDAPAAGALVVDRAGQPHATGGSDDRVRPLGLLADGPGPEACRTGEAVSAPDLAATGDRWPVFHPAAAEAGLVSVHAVPMRCRSTVLGALCVYPAGPGAVDKSVERVAQAMADLAAIGLTQARSLRRQSDLAAQLQHALTSRVVIEQAKGVIAERLHVDVDAAFTALRTYARSSNTRIAHLARSIMAGELDVERLRRR